MASSAALTTTHLPRLRKILEDWRAAQPPPEGFPIASADSPEIRGKDAGKDVIVAFRTRPPLPNEAAEKFAQQESDGNTGEAGSHTDIVPVEFCSGISVTSAEPGVVVAHTPGMNWKGPNLAHKSFEADLAFGPDVDNEEVYRRTVVAGDLLPLVLGGGIGCILAYGQTGSGKTYTMEGLEHRIARDLFNVATDVAQTSFATKHKLPRNAPEVATLTATDAFVFEVSFLELLGRTAVDLVEPPSAYDPQGNPIRKEVAIQEDRVGNVNPKLISTEVHASEELENLIVEALAHRRVGATARNATSSRSHAVLSIRVKNKVNTFAEEGQLLLVDLAGSERYEDSKAHDKQRMDESRENNKSLMNLKECVRSKAKMAADEGFVHIPWRMNKLTMLLKPIFDVESRQLSRTIVIAHVSPHIQDCVHSTSTLGYATPFKTAPPKRKGPAPYEANDPRTWTHQHTRAWFEAQFLACVRDRTKDAGAQVPLDLDVLLPEGILATHFGRVPTTEFVHRVLAARKDVPGPTANWTADEISEMAATVAGSLWHLLITAKTRKRNAVMKSRNVLHEDSHYGEAPADHGDGRSNAEIGIEWTAEEELDAMVYFDKDWKTRLFASWKTQGDGRIAYRNEWARMIKEWREATQGSKTNSVV